MVLRYNFPVCQLLSLTDDVEPTLFKIVNPASESHALELIKSLKRRKPSACLKRGQNTTRLIVALRFKI